MKLLKKYKTLLNKYEVNTPLRKAMFLAQIEHESNFKTKAESLYYTTIEGLRKTFYSPFKGKSDKFVSQYLRNSKKCANYVYANRMGNGPIDSGDGYRYRGRGFIQITGYNNYKALSEATGIDYVSNPDLLLNEADSMISALWFWSVNNLNKYADIGDLDAVSDIINIGRRTNLKGDANGYKHRKELYIKYCKLLNV